MTTDTAARVQTSKKEFFASVVKELNLDIRDPFTMILANAFALCDRCDALQAEVKTMQEVSATRKTEIEILEQKLMLASGHAERAEQSVLSLKAQLDAETEWRTKAEQDAAQVREKLDRLSKLATPSEAALEHNEQLRSQLAAARAVLIALEQAYSNKHSPQHRAVVLAEARAAIAASERSGG